MSDVTVGSIQTYLDDTILSAPTVSQNTSQERVSVTLTDSNLWLVDTSKLNGQTTDSQTQVSFLNLETSSQTTVPFENVAFNAATAAPTGLATSDSSYLQSNLDGNSLLLAQVTGGTQLGSDGVSLTSAGSSGGTASTSSGGSSGGLSSAGSGTGAAGSSAAPSASGSPSDSATADPSTGVAQSAASTSSQPLVGSSTLQSSTPVPVPFEVSPTLGVLLLLLSIGFRWGFRKPRLELPMSRQSE